MITVGRATNGRSAVCKFSPLCISILVASEESDDEAALLDMLDSYLSWKAKRATWL